MVGWVNYNCDRNKIQIPEVVICCVNQNNENKMESMRMPIVIKMIEFTNADVESLA